ncbi:hypothetical protein BCV70DRAFT_216219 [Testicularia cyperi]|uniref:Uncharacterized protein n=1 Tax=Testicularia cyperi TaxID=1882483 RepID=A0A317XR88_9BASI|nr:hypothetical protein BCV70DRAFT_216219 [Testicularia cyperi]
MPLAAHTNGGRPPGSDAKSRSKAAQLQAFKRQHSDASNKAGSSSHAKVNGGEDDEDDEDEETTTDDDSSDEDAALEMDGQELWTQTYCATCDCLIEPGEGIAKADGPDTSDSATNGGHTTLKSRSGTIKARSSTSSSDHANQTQTETAGKDASHSGGSKSGAAHLKRTHSAGRLQARAGAGPLGPHKRTGSAGSRLNALSELRPTTKLHDDKGKGKASAHESTAGSKGRKSPAVSRPNSAASNKSRSNSSGASSFKSNEANIGGGGSASANGESAPRGKSRGFLGGLTPAALKQQEAELAAKRKAPAPLYCSERCRLIDERRASGLGELAQYLSQPLVPPSQAAWAPHPAWPRSSSVSSIPLALVPDTPESDCLCPECMDKYAEAGSAGGATIPSGASDTATESSSGYIYARGAAGQKPRTASGRLVTPLNLHAPGAGPDSYFPQQQYMPASSASGSGFAPHMQTRNGVSAVASPRMRPVDSMYAPEAVSREGVAPPRSSSAASAGRASNAGTDGSVLSSESGSILWEPRMKRRADSTSAARRLSNGSLSTSRQRSSTNGSALESASGLSTSTATPAITPRHSTLMMPSSSMSSSHGTAKHGHRLSVPVFAPMREDEEDIQQPQQRQQKHHDASEASMSRSMSASLKAQASLATSPLKLLQKGSQHHAAPSIDVFSDHVGSPSTRGSLLSRSLASEHTLLGTSGITLPAQQMHGLSSSMAAMQKQAGPAAQPTNAVDTQAFGASEHADRADAADDSRLRASTDDDLSLAVGSLRLAQSSMASRGGRRTTDGLDKRPDVRRLSFFGAANGSGSGSAITGPLGERRNSTALSISSSASGSTTSGWLRSLSSVWSQLRSSASPAPMRRDSEACSGTDDSNEWPPHEDASSRRDSSVSRDGALQSSQSQQQLYPSRVTRPTSVKERSHTGHEMSPARMNRNALSHSPRPPSSQDRSSAGITPTQSLVAKPSIRRGSVPAYVREIGQGEIPGDASDSAKYGHREEGSRASTAASAAGSSPGTRSPAAHLARARADSFSTETEEERRRRRQERKEAKQRRSRDIAVLPPLLAPASRTGSSTNLYGQMPRSARTFSTGRAFTASNTPQMYVGSAGSSHQYQQQTGPGSLTTAGGNVPASPTQLRSPYHSSFALAQDAARAAMSPSRPNSAAGYHGMPYAAGTSPRAKGLGWGAMTTINPPPAPPASMASFGSSGSATGSAHPFPHHGQHHSISYGHAAAMAARGGHAHHAIAHAPVGHRQHHHHHHHHHHHSQHHNHHGQPHHGHQHQHQHQHQPHAHRISLGHVGTLGNPPNAQGQPVVGRHSTMPATLHRTPTPSVPEDGGEMTSQDLTSGEFISRPNSAMAVQQARPHRSSLMPPPRSRSSLALHRHQPQHHPHQAQPQPLYDAPVPTAMVEEPHRTWSYDHLSNDGLKTYPILQLPDRETHDIYDPAWGLDAGGLAKHLGAAPLNGQSSGHPSGSTAGGAQHGSSSSGGAKSVATRGDGSSVQKGFQPHRKKLFYFDA